MPVKHMNAFFDKTDETQMFPYTNWHLNILCQWLSYSCKAGTCPCSVFGEREEGKADREPHTQGERDGGVDPLRSSGTAGRGCRLQVTVSLVGINLGGTSTQQVCVCVSACFCVWVRGRELWPWWELLEELVSSEKSPWQGLHCIS